MPGENFVFPTRLRMAEHGAFLIAHGEPEYPLEARSNGIEGEVVLEALLGRDGEQQSLTVKSGPPLLAEAALAAVKHWNYRPCLLNGRPVEVVATIRVNFTLPNRVVAL